MDIGKLQRVIMVEPEVAVPAKGTDPAETGPGAAPAGVGSIYEDTALVGDWPLPLVIEPTPAEI